MTMADGRWQMIGYNSISIYLKTADEVFLDLVVLFLSPQIPSMMVPGTVRTQ